MNTNSSSPSARLAELNAQILQLETERVALLQQELANAELRSAEVEAFIGVYNASSGTSPSASPSQPASPARKKRAKKAGKGTKAQAAPKKKARRGKASNADRLDKAVAVVKAAGADGISALQLSEKAGIPYGAVRKLLSEGSHFRQVGEKRASRIFLK